MEHSPDGRIPLGHVLVEETDRGSLEPRPLPSLTPVDTATLAIFLEAAFSDPGRWHRVPESDLALRATSGNRSAESFSFEMRDDRFPDEPRCYRYDRGRTTLSCTADDTVEMLDLPRDHWLPRDTETFALAAVAIADPAIWEAPTSG